MPLYFIFRLHSGPLEREQRAATGPRAWLPIPIVMRLRVWNPGLTAWNDLGYTYEFPQIHWHSTPMLSRVYVKAIYIRYYPSPVLPFPFPISHTVNAEVSEVDGLFRFSVRGSGMAILALLNFRTCFINCVFSIEYSIYPARDVFLVLLLGF